jgi:integrase/recombinase XerD
MKRRSSVTSDKAQRLVHTSEQPTLTFREATDQFLKYCGIKGLAPDTVKYYDKEMKQLGRAFVDIEVPIENVSKITHSHIELFIEHQQGLNRAVSTINSRIRAGRTFFKFCKRKGYVKANPFDGISQLKTRHVVGATFNKRQLKRLLDAPNLTTFIGLRDLAIMLTLAHTGIRLTELTSLRIQDVSFDGKGAITVQRTKNRYGRRIPMTKRLKAVLQAYMEERGAIDTDILFINVEDEPLSGRTVQQRLKEYGKASKVEDEVTVSPHAFRRTFCRLKVESGVNLFVLQRLTGHHSLEVLKRYVEIFGRDLEEAIEKGFE